MYAKTYKKDDFKKCRRPKMMYREITSMDWKKEHSKSVSYSQFYTEAHLRDTVGFTPTTTPKPVSQ